MDFNSAANIISDAGMTVYHAYLPSLETEIRFRAITVGEQKTLSKFGLNNRNDTIKIEKELINLFQKSCLDEFVDFDKLLDIDKVSMMYSFYINNYPSQLFTQHCKKCDKDYDAELDFEQVFDKLRKISCKPKYITIINNTVKYVFEVGNVLINDVIEFYSIKETKFEINKLHKQIQPKDRDVAALVNTYQARNIVENLLKLNVRKITVTKGETISEIDCSIYSVKERIQMIDMLPVDVVLAKKTKGLLDQITDIFFTPVHELSLRSKCTHCSHQHRIDMNIGDFFL